VCVCARMHMYCVHLCVRISLSLSLSVCLSVCCLSSVCLSLLVKWGVMMLTELMWLMVYAFGRLVSTLNEELNSTNGWKSLLLISVQDQGRETASYQQCTVAFTCSLATPFIKVVEPKC